MKVSGRVMVYIGKILILLMIISDVALGEIFIKGSITEPLTN